MNEPEKDRTRPSAATRAEEATEATAAPDAGRPATDEEARAADSNAPLDPEVAENYEDMTERGAKQRGEGRVP